MGRGPRHAREREGGREREKERERARERERGNEREGHRERESERIRGHTFSKSWAEGPGTPYQVFPPPKWW